MEWGAFATIRYDCIARRRTRQERSIYIGRADRVTVAKAKAIGLPSRPKWPTQTQILARVVHHLSGFMGAHSVRQDDGINATRAKKHGSARQQRPVHACMLY
uniref:Uncharacterized protein n=1 Tax=Zea mays TaxID=4577 RepID=C0PP62_MAIZE|nr:unknown [Zea mays]